MTIATQTTTSTSDDSWRPPPLAGLRRTATGWAWGHPQAIGYVEQWRPVRHVQHEQWCQLCWGRIPPDSPGASKGSRGTKAFFEPNLGLWEHITCRTGIAVN